MKCRSGNNFRLALRGLLHTSIELRNEGLPAYFSQNIFTTEISVISVIFETLRTHTSLVPVSYLRQMRITLGCHDDWHANIQIPHDRIIERCYPFCLIGFNPICWETSKEGMHRGRHQVFLSNRELDFLLIASHFSLSYDAISSTNKRTYFSLPLLPLTSYSTLHTTTYTLPASLFSTSS